MHRPKAESLKFDSTVVHSADVKRNVATITSLNGTPAAPLGLAAGTVHDRGCIRRAFDQGINYFFFYGPGHGNFARRLAPLARKHRDKFIVATGSGSRKLTGLLNTRRKILAALKHELIDVFFAEYVTATEDQAQFFGHGGTLDQLHRWKSDGWIRYVGVTTHHRGIAQRVAEDPRVDVLMHRFNMAHRKAAQEVFPTAIRTRTPVVAFTATRWGTLLEAPADWSGAAASAPDCYRYCLAQPAVHVVLTAPRSVRELDENLAVLKSPRMSRRDCARWERFGDLILGSGTSAFETRWP